MGQSTAKRDNPAESGMLRQSATVGGGGGGGGGPFTVRSQCATAINPISVQIKIYTGEVVVEEEVFVSVV